MTRDTDISYRVWQRHSLKEYRRARLDWITVACPDQLLANKLKQASHSFDGYDPFYANYPRHLENRYDFVTCTEVVEHFRLPDLEFPCLFELLKPGGLLGLMTELAIDAEAFAGRHHKNDMTHISFYFRPTLRWLVERYRFEAEFVGKDVILFSAQVCLDDDAPRPSTNNELLAALTMASTAKAVNSA